MEERVIQQESVTSEAQPVAASETPKAKAATKTEPAATPKTTTE